MHIYNIDLLEAVLKFFLTSSQKDTITELVHGSMGSKCDLASDEMTMKSVFHDFMVPHFKKFPQEIQQELKTTLIYILNSEEIDILPFFYSLYLPFEISEHPKDIFIWLFEVLYVDSWKIHDFDPSQYETKSLMNDDFYDEYDAYIDYIFGEKGFFIRSRSA